MRHEDSGQIFDYGDLLQISSWDRTLISHGNLEATESSLRQSRNYEAIAYRCIVYAVRLGLLIT